MYSAAVLAQPLYILSSVEEQRHDMLIVACKSAPSPVQGGRLKVDEELCCIGPAL